MRILRGAAGRLLATAALVLCAALSAFGSEMDFEPSVGVVVPDQPAKIGDRVLLPVKIDYSPEWRSAKIKFGLDKRTPLDEGVSPNSVRFEEVYLDASQQSPLVVNVPVTVTGEGVFKFVPVFSINAHDGKKFENGESEWEIRSVGTAIGILSFDGEVFFGGNAEAAFGKKADRNLRASNSEYTNLVKKREAANKNSENRSIKNQAFTEEDEKRFWKTRESETNRLLKEFSQHYPAKPTPTSRAVPFKQPKNGEQVILSVNFPTSDSYTNFLPLHGAYIDVINNSNNRIIKSGLLNNGKFSFVSPDDNLSFTAFQIAI